MVKVSLYVTEEENLDLDMYCKQRHISKSRVIRDALRSVIYTPSQLRSATPLDQSFTRNEWKEHMTQAQEEKQRIQQKVDTEKKEEELTKPVSLLG